MFPIIPQLKTQQKKQADKTAEVKVPPHKRTRV